MKRRRAEPLILLVAIGAVAAIAGLVIWLGLRTMSATQAVGDAEPALTARVDAAPSKIPGGSGTVCGLDAVKMVKEHPSPDGRAIDASAHDLLAERGRVEGTKLHVVGWRGRPARRRRGVCRVSLRFKQGKARNAIVWHVEPDAPPSSRLFPEDATAVALTGRVALEDAEQEGALTSRCRTKSIDIVQRHFSFWEQHDLWRCMRKVAAREQITKGIEIELGNWSASPEGSDRCIVTLKLKEDGIPRREHWRVRFAPEGEELAVEPLTPRGTEAIYGPGVYSRPE